MAQNQHLSRAAYAYILAVITAGLVAVGYSLFSLVVRPLPYQWMLLAALTLLTGSFSVKVPSLAARISVSEAFVFAAVLLYGPAVATLIVALDSLVMSLWLRRDQRFGVRSLFNLAAVALAMFIAAEVFFWTARVEPGDITQLLPLERRIWQLFTLATVYFLLNSWLVAGVLALDRVANPLVLWWRNFPWLSLNYFGGVSAAALLVSYTQSFEFGAIAIILPLLVISYLTYRTSLGRIEDATRHVEQVNALYMSTVETLAMAVDAKDQITHGHIRRVQVYTVELAKRLGVNDDRQLQAIAAAALLHDMGKLAIPEHILNKPGKLTEAEFEKMKRHADIGADLLSSIMFPYPVVPIVRHHHEWWAGGGYPAGIAGTDIPLGARILAVVDCFDALTSDRPYRPRLTAREAFEVIRERRGTMYDPLVVDTFVSAYSEIAPMAIKAGQDAKSLMTLGGDSIGQSSVFTAIRSSAVETSALRNLERDLEHATSPDAVTTVTLRYARELIPAALFAYYRYIPADDSLVCDTAIGDSRNVLTGLVIRLGERVTGWTVANRRTSINSHASLDLASMAASFDPPLRSSLSVSVQSGDIVYGAITLYCSREDSFSEASRYSIERIAASIAARLNTLSLKSPSFVVAFPRVRADMRADM
jgi:putative nucleotidyltransferase with HDIG domain